MDKKQKIKKPIGTNKVKNNSKTNHIKKKIPEKKATNSKNNRSMVVKSRIEKKLTKEDKQTRMICLGFLLLTVIIFYFIYGLTIALIDLLGLAIILGVSFLLKKSSGKKARKVLKAFIIIILILGIVGLSGFSVFLLYVKKEADPLFVTDKLDKPENSTFLDINNEEYAKLGAEMREKVTYDELPQVLIDAIIATEDSRFYQHNGFDAPRFLKASIGQVAQKLFHVGGNAGGASTLTMQVVKNQLTDANATKTQGTEGVIRKFEDIYLAIFKMEKNYTKEQIIEYYVNNHYLGGNIYGVQEASQEYFGKTVSELNLSEAAILAGMFKSPNYYRPTANPKNATARRTTVLSLMKRHGYITEEEYKIANSIPVDSLTATIESSNVNPYQGYIDTVVAELDKKYGVNPYTTSLTVYTNLDRTKQNAVNAVMNGEVYGWIDDQVQAGVSVLDSATGKILAIGNGRNIRGRSASRINQLNYATDIKRQPGSTAKPLFDYGPGIEYLNWSTYKLFDDAPHTYSTGRSIKNWDGNYFGVITLRRALATSRNIPALKAFQQVTREAGNEKIVEFVTNLGLKPEIENGKVHEAHSIGAFTGTNPLQMSAAYAAFSNGGYYNEPYSVSKFIYKNTNQEVVHEEVHRQVMSDATAYMISSVLQDVALNGGTPRNVACKTGTTNYDEATMTSRGLPWDAIRDSWVVGYSTKTVVALWYGYDFIDSTYVLHNVPASIQKDYIFRALVNAGAMESDRASFAQPSSVVQVAVVNDQNVNAEPRKACTGNEPNITYEYFKKGYEPTECYISQNLASPTNFTVTYNQITKRVSLSWGAVSPAAGATEQYGNIKYDIYAGDTHVGSTEKTSYTYTPKTPYQTYKVVATYTYKNDIQSTPATFTLREIKAEDLKLVYNGATKIPKDGLTVSLNDFTVTDKGTPVSLTIVSCTPTKITEAGKITFTCTIEYDKEYKLSTTVELTMDTDEEPEPNNP